MYTFQYKPAPDLARGLWEFKTCDTCVFRQNTCKTRWWGVLYGSVIKLLLVWGHILLLCRICSCTCAILPLLSFLDPSVSRGKDPSRQASISEPQITSFAVFRIWNVRELFTKNEQVPNQGFTIPSLNCYWIAIGWNYGGQYVRGKPTASTGEIAKCQLPPI